MSVYVGAPLDGARGSPPRRLAGRVAGFTVLLCTAALFAYFPALQGERLLDDEHHLTRAELASTAGLTRIWTEIGATQQYYPVLHTVFWLEHRCWGETLWPYHLVSLGLHLVAALLIVALARELALPGGWFAGFVFALHPVATESVAWIAEQKNTLSTMFALAAALMWFRFDRTRNARQYLFATALFALALLSKISTAPLPLALLVVAWWRRKREIGLRPVGRDVLPLLPWLALAAGLAPVTLRVEASLLQTIRAQLTLSWLERAGIAGNALWFYLGKLAWPANLTFFYAKSAPTILSFVAAVTALGLGIALASVGRQHRGPLTAGLAFVLLLSPVLGFVNVEWFVFAYVADHFQYLAGIAVIVGASAVFATTSRQLAAGASRGPVLLATMVIAALALLTRAHAKAFRSNAALYTEAATRTPGSVVAHHHRGLALAQVPGRGTDAIAEYEIALRLNPDAAEVHEDLGAVLLDDPTRRVDAQFHLERALQLRPDLARVRRLLAVLHFDRARALPGDQTEAAIAEYAAALHYEPHWAEAHYNLGNALLRLPGRERDAEAAFEQALACKPDFPEAHTNLGALLARSPGRLPEAIAHFKAALRANPDFTPARNNLRRAQQLGRSPPQLDTNEHW